MPHYAQNAPLLPELVYEVDRAGRKQGTWRIPVEAFPTAINGQTLYFRFGSESLSVSKHGRLRKAAPSGQAPEVSDAKCGAADLFDGSSYAVCWTFKDLQSRRRRTLAFLAPCS